MRCEKEKVAPALIFSAEHDVSSQQGSGSHYQHWQVTTEAGLGSLYSLFAVIFLHALPPVSYKTHSTDLGSAQTADLWRTEWVQSGGMGRIGAAHTDGQEDWTTAISSAAS